MVGVNGSTSGTVSYKFDLFDNVNPTASLTLGHEVTGTIINPGDQFSYTFTGSVGQQIYFDSRDATTGIDALLTSPYGNTVFNTDFSSGDEGPFTLTQAGTYTLTVYGNTYTALRLRPRRHRAGDGHHARHGHHRDPGLRVDHQPVHVRHRRGQTIYFDGLADSPAFVRLAVIYSPTDNYVDEFYTESSGVVTLPGAGTYVLAVVGDGTAAAR